VKQRNSKSAATISQQHLYNHSESFSFSCLQMRQKNRATIFGLFYAYKCAERNPGKTATIPQQDLYNLIIVLAFLSLKMCHENPEKQSNIFFVILCS